MKQADFSKKAADMGDFYVYFVDNTGSRTFIVATADLSTEYIKGNLKSRAKFKRQHAEDKSVVLWDWNFNRLVEVPYASITKLVPLASVLKNGQS